MIRHEGLPSTTVDRRLTDRVPGLPPRHGGLGPLGQSSRDVAEAEHEASTVMSDNPVCASQAPNWPKECDTFAQLGIPDTYIEGLLFKHLLAVGSNTGRGIARDLCVPGKPLLAMVTEMKNRQFVAYKGSAAMGDFEYVLTDAGRERAQRFLEGCSYCGATPVPLSVYIESVHAQTIRNEHPNPEALRQAFHDLLIEPAMLERLGPAINSGQGMFLYGAPGNGKTSIAERVTSCFGTDIWIPKAIFVDGETIQFYDPQSHEAVVSDKAPARGQEFDQRWIRIRRPTMVVGGELTMEVLELQYNAYTKITEPSLQLKSNCGTLVIDDFGRQRMNPIQLLNRWIVPLEKRFDYLTLHNGKKIQVPFDQIIVFSTNLEPRELVDDAFLRRIPYKINVGDPAEAEFRELMKIMADKLEVAYDQAAVSYVIEKHYAATGRPFRCCHPRDLLLQIRNRSRYRGEEARMSTEGFDAACANYFTLL